MRETKAHLDLLLLASVAHRPAHGYAIIEALRSRTEGVFDLPESTVYPALHRLERDGLLSSDWSVVDGRRRCCYRITPPGAAALRERRQLWFRWRRGVDLAIGGAP